MNTYQRIKNGLFGGVSKRYLLGRRLVLNFPNSQGGKISVVALPDWRSTTFGVEPSLAGSGHALVLSGPDGERFELAVFERQGDAVSALGKVRGQFTRPLLTAAKWLGGAVGLVVLVLWGMSTPLMKGMTQKMAAPPSMGLPGMTGGLPAGLPGGGMANGTNALEQLRAIQNKGGAAPGIPGMPAMPSLGGAGGASGLAAGLDPNETLSADKVNQLIKQRYGLDVNTIPGGKEAVEQALTTIPLPGQNVGANGQVVSPAGVPVAPQTNGDAAATLNLLQKSK